MMKLYHYLLIVFGLHVALLFFYRNQFCDGVGATAGTARYADDQRRLMGQLSGTWEQEKEVFMAILLCFYCN